VKEGTCITHFTNNSKIHVLHTDDSPRASNQPFIRFERDDGPLKTIDRVTALYLFNLGSKGFRDHWVFGLETHPCIAKQGITPDDVQEILEAMESSSRESIRVAWHRAVQKGDAQKIDLKESSLDLLPRDLHQFVRGFSHVDASDNLLHECAALNGLMITQLDLSNNFLSYFPEISLPNLHSLNLRSNLINVFPEGAFPRLERLDLSQNYLSHCSLSAKTMPRLITLNLMGNPLEMLGILPRDGAMRMTQLQLPAKPFCRLSIEIILSDEELKAFNDSITMRTTSPLSLKFHPFPKLQFTDAQLLQEMPQNIRFFNAYGEDLLFTQHERMRLAVSLQFPQMKLTQASSSFSRGEECVNIKKSTAKKLLRKFKKLTRRE
jgi:hypothetical protein